MPRVLTSEVPVAVQLALAEEIYTISSELTVDSGYRGPNAQSMVTILTDKFADGVVLSTSEAITSALGHCSKLRASGACTKVVQRLITISQQATANILETVLVPVIPTLRELYTLLHPPLTGAVHTLLQVVSMRWATIALGQKPQNPSTLTRLAHWGCTCSNCQTAKDFLRTPSLEQPSLSLTRIGARLRKHLETHLRKYAASAVIYSTIQSKPQGLQVRDPDHRFSALHNFAPKDRSQGPH